MTYGTKSTGRRAAERIPQAEADAICDAVVRLLRAIRWSERARSGADQ